MEEYFYFRTYFYGDSKRVCVSLGSSEFLFGVNNPQYNITNHNIKYDNIYPDKPTSGNVTTGYFNISKKDNNVFLNALYNNSFYEAKLGLARRVNYYHSLIEYSYDLDFMSQLIKQGVIDKHYIYLTPFFDIEGKPRNDISMELGRLPVYFDDKYKFSYIPLNNFYPKKWAVKLSHIILGDIKSENIYDIYADVIFTDSYKADSLFPESLKTYLRTIFVDKMDCEFSLSYIKCPVNKINTTKFYFVFNGYAHYIPSSLLFSNSGNETHKYSHFKFSSEIEYISIDSYILGAYHRLYDGENNTVRFVYPGDDNFIVDVQDYTGYENRDGTKKEIPSIEYLRDYERTLKRQEENIQETLIKIEDDKKIIIEKTESLNKREMELQKYEEDLKKREEEMKDKIEKADELEKENENLKEEIKNKDKRIQSLETENTNIKAENENLKQEIKNKDEQIQSLEAENANIKTENENLKNEIKNKNEKIQSLEAENANIKTENENLKQEIKNKNEKIQSLETENANIKTENNNFKNEIKNKNEKIQNLEEEISNMKSELEKLNKDISDKKNEITNLNDSLNSEKKKSVIELVCIIIILIISIAAITVIVIKCKSKSKKAELDQIVNNENNE